MTATSTEPTGFSAAAAPTVGAGSGEFSAAASFARLRGRFHDALPARVQRVVPRTAIGFAAISGFTYAVDLTLLALGFDVLGLPYPVAVTVGYLVAFGLAFVLNRWLNFQSHGDVGRQTGRYVLVVAANYLLFILALSSTLEAVGVQFLVARLIAGACEAVFMYTMMRLFVFRYRGQHGRRP